MDIRLPFTKKRIYALKCRDQNGKWITVDELEYKISSKEAKEIYEEEIEGAGCTKIKLEEYVEIGDENRRYVKKHWERRLSKSRGLSPSDVLGATAFTVLDALEACQKLQEFIRGAIGGSNKSELGEILELLTTLQQFKLQNPALMQLHHQQQQLPIQELPDNSEVEELKQLAKQIIEENTSVFSSLDETSAPCFKKKNCPGGGLNEAGEG